jgi:hypothetical protein
LRLNAKNGVDILTSKEFNIVNGFGVGPEEEFVCDLGVDEELKVTFFVEFNFSRIERELP